VALALGNLLRNTGQVQRGLGTIRQDVNISIRNGARVEIKGAQDLELFETMIENEVKRQLESNKLTDELKKSKAKVHEPIEITNLLTNTSCKFVVSALQKNGAIYAARLEGFASKLKQELGAEGQRLGRELGDYAKLAGTGGIMHSDENLLGYGFTDGEIEKVRKKLEAKETDAIVMCVDSPQKAQNAIALVLKRAKLALTDGVVPETRRAEGSITRFMRPLAGAARMYPETDIRVIEVNEKLVKSLEPIKTSSDLVSELVSNYELSEEIAKRLAGEETGKIFEQVASAVNGGKDINAKIANTLLQTVVSLRRTGIRVETITPAHFVEIFKRYKEGKVTGVAIEELLLQVANRKAPPGEIISIIVNCKLERFDKKQIAKLLAENNCNFGELMKLYRKNVDASDAQEVLKGLKAK
ncbi:MAG: hypothetical protein Q7K43_01645, partial [Candidatus Woesearchaeota archaeon]|nr:hypothetical protein [Candidatus Woesearchaeota archaeon]